MRTVGGHARATGRCTAILAQSCRVGSAPFPAIRRLASDPHRPRSAWLEYGLARHSPALRVSGRSVRHRRADTAAFLAARSGIGGGAGARPGAGRLPDPGWPPRQRSWIAGTGSVWDSGRVEQSGSTNVAFGGRAPATGERCYCAVQVSDETGDPGPWSEPAWFEMGLLEAADCAASWICASVAAISSPLLRKECDLTAAVTRARAYVAGSTAPGWATG